MASSMWDTLLGGDPTYPVRVGNYCFDKDAGSTDVVAHKIDAPPTKPCCKECEKKKDFEGVDESDFDAVLTAVQGAIANADAAAAAAAVSGSPTPAPIKLTTNINGWSNTLLEYYRRTITEPSAKGKQGTFFAGYAALFTNATAVTAALDDEKANFESMYENALKRRRAVVNAAGTGVEYIGDDGTTYTSRPTVPTTDCTGPGERMKTLQEKLVKQLDDLAKQAGDEQPNALCGLACSEDIEMARMLKMYEKLLKDAQAKTGGQSVGCDLTKFEDDETLKLLRQKQGLLEKQSFAFLHAECEAVEQCEPHEHLINDELIDCSGLHESEILFNDTHMAAIGQYLAGAQRDGQSPGALGHASRLYKSGTIAPGVNPDELWINVCYRVPGVDDGDEKKIDTMWVRANVCDQRKYETLRAIRKAITEQKRAILALNREILDLQYQVSAGHGFAGPAAFFSTARREGAADDGLRTQMAIKSSVARAANSMRRNSDRRRKPQLLEAEDGAYADDGFGGAEDPRFARMMRTLAVVVRGAR